MFEIDLDNIGQYSAEELSNLREQANAALDAAFAIEHPTEADVEEAERVLAAVEAIEAEDTRRTEASTSAVERMAALRESRVEASTDPADSADDAEAAEAAEDEEEEEEEEPVEAALTASTPRAPVTTKRRPIPRPKAPPKAERRVTITAGADIPQFSTGSVIEDLDGVAKALINRTKGFPTQPQGIAGAPLARHNVASFSRNFTREETATNSSEDYSKVMAAAKEKRLPGGSLLAAGGWCAPSENLYDLCDGETTDGLIDLPEIGVSRGGIRFTPGPQFSTLYSAGFTQTEAQAIAGTAKPCYEITCPAFEEVRLDAMGICIKVPLLTNSAYPELTRRVISGSLTAHMHRVSAGLIGKMVTEAGTAVAMTDANSATANLLNSAGVVITTIRQEYRLGLNETLEVVLPQWVREAIRADLALRSGVDLLAVSDAQIEGFFRERKANVQWVYNWQDLTDGQEGFPASVQMLVYPAGTFVRGSTDVINLDAVYDAASLTANTMTGLFFEEGVLLAQTCFKVKLLTIVLDVAGVAGANSNSTSFTLV
jgi:hypothetical protein